MLSLVVISQRRLHLASVAATLTASIRDAANPDSFSQTVESDKFARTILNLEGREAQSFTAERGHKTIKLFGRD